MEILGVLPSSKFRFPPNKLAFHHLPSALAVSRSPPPPPYLSHASPLRYHGNRRLVVPCAAHPDPPTPDGGEARAILRDFLKESDGTRGVLEERKVLETVDLLSSKLRSLHESEQQLGVELARPQLLDLFTPYLRSILKDQGGDEQLPCEKTEGEEAQSPPSEWLRHKKKAVALLEMQLSEGGPPPHVLRLMSHGLDLAGIRSMVSLYPSLQSAAIKQKLDGVMEFLTSLGLPEDRAAVILRRCPRLLRLSIEENIVPSMAFLESKGVDKTQWPKIVDRCPVIFMQGKAKVEAVVEYFSEMGLSDASIGRLLTYSPRLLCFSIETKIKPISRFFLDNGFTVEEFHGIISKLNSIYNLHLERTLKPKWEFLLTMGYTRSDVLKFPQYFCLSLERRIKPRYELAAKHGIRWSLSYLLTPSNAGFKRNVLSNLREQTSMIEHSN